MYTYEKKSSREPGFIRNPTHFIIYIILYGQISNTNSITQSDIILTCKFFNNKIFKEY